MDINRYNALIVIRSILHDGMKVKDSMAKHLSSEVHERDRAFVMEVVYGTVRYKLFLEWLLSTLLEKRKKLRILTHLNLLTGLYQLAVMRISEWAAVNETVEIEKHMKGNPSLVNAVLRNYIRKGDSAITSLPADKIRNMSIITSHPEWMVKRWRARLSDEELSAFTRANNEIPPLTMRINTLASSFDEIAGFLTSSGIAFDLPKYCPQAISLKNIPFSAIRPLKRKVFIQDEASQVISLLLNPLPGQIILDACAAPGGKTTHIAQITGDEARIIAVDNSRRRMDLLKENIENMGCTSIAPVLSDIQALGETNRFDRILVDAPCSALGTIRRSPDVKYRHDVNSIRLLGERQLEILLHTSSLLQKGGILMYSVCTTEPEETTEVIQKFLNIRRDFYIIDNILDIALPEPFRTTIESFFVKGGYMLSYPHIHGTDGFFAVRFGRK